MRASSHEEAQANLFPNWRWGGLPAFISKSSTSTRERILKMNNLSKCQPDGQKYITDSKCDASAASNLWKTGANPRFQRRRSRRRPRQRRLSPEAKWWIFQLFFLFRVCVFVGLLAFLHSWGIVTPAVYLMVGQIFLAVLGKMPPPPAGEDGRSNYTLRA